MSEYTLIIGNKNYSSWSLRPWLVMKHLGIEFNEILIPLYLSESKAEILKYSPSGKVPALIHRGLTLWESLAICDYLAEQFPERHLWPQEPEARACARAISAEMHAGFMNLREALPMDMRATNPSRAVSEAVRSDIERITGIWGSCRRRYWRSGPFLFGKFTIADAMYAPVVSRFATYGIRLDNASQIYCNAIWQVPAMNQWHEAAMREPWTIITSHNQSVHDE